MSIHVTLPDGSVQTVADRSTPLDIAKGISPRLADDAIVARVDGQLYDLTRPLEGDVKLEILTAEEIPRRWRSTGTRRRTCWRRRCWSCIPRRSWGSGPPIDNGFYYDFERATPFTPEDLEKIEKRMWEFQAADLPYERKFTEKDAGLGSTKTISHEVELITEQRRRCLFGIHAGSAVHRFLPRPARSVHQEDQGVQAAFASPARIGKATRRTRSCSASTGRRSSSKKDLDDYLASWKKPRSAIIASWARNWTCSASRSWPVRG